MANKEVKKTKKKINWKGIIKSAIAIILIVGIILVCFRLIKGKTLDTNTSEINDLYTYLGQNDLSYCTGLSTYSDERIDYDTLENKDRICNAVAYLYAKEDSTLIKIDKTKKNSTCSLNDDIIFATDNYEEDTCSLYRFDKEKIKDKYKAIYGHDYEDDETFNLNSTTICYPYEDYYYCGLSETFTITVGAEPATYRSIKEAVEKGNKLIIYDYFIKIANGECYTTYTEDTTNNNCTTDYKADTNIDYGFIKKNGTYYKHTYKKGDDGNYYWVSSVPN